ncbi:MAG: DUF4327 family protein [Rivularia sp. (in: cyanobacteria)]
MLQTAQAYNIDNIKDEIRELVDEGKLCRNEPICRVCKFIPPREWICFECELEKYDYLPRDWIVDLIGDEKWVED